MMFFIGLILVVVFGAYWSIARVEHSTNAKKKVGVALLNALGWLLMLIALVRWWL